jgi:regulator of protease activity HflC (stomatin/prohibitin superfamily)
MRNEYESRVIVPVIQEAVKASTAKYTAEELIEKRPLVKEEISTYLKSRLEDSYGLEVTDVSITNFQFSQNFNTAIEQKMVAQQDALKANYTLQQKTVEAQTRIVEANASAEAAILAAKGQATSTIIVAQATAEAIQLKTNNLSDLYVRLLYVERWNGQLPQVLGQAGIFVPLATQENENSQIGS